MNITIRNNRIYVEHAELGQHFPGLVGDFIVDANGRMNVTSPASFHTSLDPSLLLSIAKHLETEAHNKTLMKLKKKIDRIAHAKLVNGIIK